MTPFDSSGKTDMICTSTEVLLQKTINNGRSLPLHNKTYYWPQQLSSQDRPEGPGVGGDATEQQEEEAAQEDVQPQQPPPMGRAARRARQDHTRALIQQAIGTIQATEAGRQRRHEERLAARRQAAEDKRRRHQQLIGALDRGMARIAAAIERRRVFYPDT
ncbi:hypothetical protein HPB48_006762 [Haemaphysalis longicornis]|uniref:Uncharacterized protein n=1 Tax=Haemaphysalis longicornis TaxID=44386 RepID=A0A9J6FBV2_HAELO|nr:hypothetical protein HPB48_006762 [Haemaphysalis longicornis]